MRFKKDDGSYFELLVNASAHSIDIKYNLRKLDNGKYIARNNFPKRDKYSATLEIRAEAGYITSLVTELTLLRKNNKEVILDQMEENIFGDNIDHTGEIACVLPFFGNQESPAMNVQSINITFLPTELVFTPEATLPNLSCANEQWTGFAEWKATTNQSLNSFNYFVDREADSYEFTGEYMLSLEENKNLLGFWKTQRGVPFLINDGDWGVYKMFGGYINTAQHQVIIKAVEYERVSPVLRKTKITLVRVG